MKILFQAVLGSLIIHVIYFLSTILIGFIKTVNYKPDLVANWEHVAVLQNEVAFGMVFSPVMFLFTFVFIAGIVGVILILTKFVKRETERRG